MHDRRVPDSYIAAHEAWEIVLQVQNGAVLNIRVGADDNAVDVPTIYGVVPDTLMIADDDVSHHDRATRNVNTFADPRCFRQVSVQPLLQVHSLTCPRSSRRQSTTRSP